MILIFDDIDEAIRRNVYTEINKGRWQFNWKSKPATDQYSFFHQHYAGHVTPDHDGGQAYECEPELWEKHPVFAELWDELVRKVAPLQGNRLIRCYANGYPYGSDGTVHTDTVDSRGMTTIFYPHEKWSPDWGGETVFFSSDLSEIVQSVYPRPGRAVIFSGIIPHVARGVSRSCPVMRVTLMFKSEALA